MPMTCPRVAAERRKFARRRNSAKAGWFVIALIGISSTVTLYRAFSIADTYQLDGWKLLWLMESLPMDRTFAGHEVAYLAYAYSALAGYIVLALVVVMMIGNLMDLRSESVLWTHIDDLENQRCSSDNSGFGHK